MYAPRTTRLAVCILASLIVLTIAGMGAWQRSIDSYLRRRFPAQNCDPFVRMNETTRPESRWSLIISHTNGLRSGEVRPILAPPQSIDADVGGE